MTISFWPADPRTIDTHVHVDSVDYRPVEEFTAFWGSRRAVLSEHFTSPSSDYITRLIDARPNRYRGLLLLHPGAAEDPGLRRVLAQPDRLGARVRLRTDDDVVAAAPAIDAIARRGGFVSLHCTWTVMSGTELPTLLDRHPALDVRIEHFGSWPYDEHPHFDGMARDVFRRPSVYTMISSQYAFTTEPHPYPAATRITKEYLEEVGPERVMWSTDWNRNDLDPARGDDYLHEAAEFLEQVVGADHAPQVLFRSAERFFRFPLTGELTP